MPLAARVRHSHQVRHTWAVRSSKPVTSSPALAIIARYSLSDPMLGSRPSRQIGSSRWLIAAGLGFSDDSQTQLANRPPGLSVRATSAKNSGLSTLCSELSIDNTAAKLASGNLFSSQSRTISFGLSRGWALLA